MKIILQISQINKQARQKTRDPEETAFSEIYIFLKIFFGFPNFSIQKFCIPLWILIVTVEEWWGQSDQFYLREKGWWFIWTQFVFHPFCYYEYIPWIIISTVMLYM